MQQRQYFKSKGKAMPKSSNGIKASVPKRLRKAKPTHGTVKRAGRAFRKKEGTVKHLLALGN